MSARMLSLADLDRLIAEAETIRDQRRAALRDLPLTQEPGPMRVMFDNAQKQVEQLHLRRELLLERAAQAKPASS